LMKKLGLKSIAELIKCAIQFEIIS
jgi:hypothetical protein